MKQRLFIKEKVKRVLNVPVINIISTFGNPEKPSESIKYLTTTTRGMGNNKTQEGNNMTTFREVQR